jgi:hypothetical protein
MKNEHMIFWLKQWNQSPVLKEVQKFPKVGVSNAIFEKWLHKATFWYQVPMIEPFSIKQFFEFECLFLSVSMDFDAQ